MRYREMLNLVCIGGLIAGSIGPAKAGELSSLEGTWIMDSAYEIHGDGTRTTDYGEHPKGLFIVDRDGRYSMQIFKIGRPLFAGANKAQGTPEEYRTALVGISTHIGRVTIDGARHQLIFDVEAASFPNWEGKRQIRDFTYTGGVLSYAVPANASGSGTIAYSVWRRAQSDHRADSHLSGNVSGENQ